MKKPSKTKKEEEKEETKKQKKLTIFDAIDPVAATLV
jgi:hypothetical protein